MSKERTPRFEYDCGHCKLNWCCGELCACFKWPDAIKTPRSRMTLVNKLQRAWRRLVRPRSQKSLAVLKTRCLDTRKAWYKANPKFAI